MRETFSRSASSLAQAASMQSAFASMEISPWWSMTEMMTLVFTNLMVLVTDQIWHEDTTLRA